MPRSVSFVVVTALVVAACSSGGGDSATTTSPAGTDDSAVGSPSTAGSQPDASSAPTTAPPGSTSTPSNEPATTSTPDDSTPDDSTAPPTDPPGTTQPTEAPSTTAAPDLTDAEMADQDLARTALITIASFPDGWIEEPDDQTDDPDDDEYEAQFDECLGRDDDLRVGDDLEALSVATGDFRPVDDESTSVSHEVVLAPDVDTAITAMSEVAVDGAEGCLADVIQRFYVSRFADDPDLADVGVGEVTVTQTERERPADLAVGVLLEIPLTVSGQPVSQFLEVLYQRQGRALSELSFSSLGGPFSRDGYTVLSDEAAIGLAAIG